MLQRSTVPARLLVAALADGCAPGSPPASQSRTVRLVDEYQPDTIAGAAAAAAPALPRTEWRFDEAPAAPATFAATRGWRAGPDVAGLAVRDGRLVGKATGDFPILH